MMKRIRPNMQANIAVWIMCASLPAAALADEKAHIHHADDAAVSEILEDYTERCHAARLQAGLISEEGTLDKEQLSAPSIYRIKIDDNEAEATVLYTDFSCEGVGILWCGTGGCNTYMIVDGNTFEAEVTFPPYTLEIPNPYGESVRTAVIFPLHGTYCRTASQEHGFGSFGCYEIALWEDDRKTFLTRTGFLELYDTNLP